MDEQRDEQFLEGDVATSDEEVADAPAEEHHSLVDRMRHSGVGVEDPNIVGDVGPVDVAPGSDGEPLIVEAEPGEEDTIRP
jgi:hypothetical protein